jgi:hypothetical protein
MDYYWLCMGGLLPTCSVYAFLSSEPVVNRKIRNFDLLPLTGPVESRASGVLKLDSSGGSHYLIWR